MNGSGEENVPSPCPETGSRRHDGSARLVEDNGAGLEIAALRLPAVQAVVVIVVEAVLGTLGGGGGKGREPQDQEEGVEGEEGDNVVAGAAGGDALGQDAVQDAEPCENGLEGSLSIYETRWREGECWTYSSNAQSHDIEVSARDEPRRQGEDDEGQDNLQDADDEYPQGRAEDVVGPVDGADGCCWVGHGWAVVVTLLPCKRLDGRMGRGGQKGTTDDGQAQP